MFNLFRFFFWNLRLLNTSRTLLVGTNLPTTFVCDERPAVQFEGFILFRLRKSSQFSPKKIQFNVCCKNMHFTSWNILRIKLSKYEITRPSKRGGMLATQKMQNYKANFFSKLWGHNQKMNYVWNYLWICKILHKLMNYNRAFL